MIIILVYGSVFISSLFARVTQEDMTQYLVSNECLLFTTVCSAGTYSSTVQ